MCATYLPIIDELLGCISSSVDASSLNKTILQVELAIDREETGGRQCTELCAVRDRLLTLKRNAV